MRLILCYAFLLALMAGGCGSRNEVAPGHAAGAAVLVESADARRCEVNSQSATPYEQAVRCAERFVERNGYTTRAATNNGIWAPEAGEEGKSITEIRARRRGTLRREAIVVCRGTDERGRETYAVGFAGSGDPPSPSGRAVTMDSAFADLRMRPGSFPLITALGDTTSCRSMILKPAQ